MRRRILIALLVAAVVALLVQPALAENWFRHWWNDPGGFYLDPFWVIRGGY